MHPIASEIHARTVMEDRHRTAALARRAGPASTRPSLLGRGRSHGSGRSTAVAAIVARATSVAQALRRTRPAAGQAGDSPAC